MNLASKKPDVRRALETAYDAWLEQMVDPITGGKKRWAESSSGEELSDREKKRQARRKKQRAEKRAQRKKNGGQQKKKQDASKPRVTTRPRNVLFIVCDDLNTRVSTSGYQHIRTPALDQLAAAGTGAVGKVFHNTKIDPGDVAWHESHRFQNDELPLVTRAREAFEAEHGSIDKGDRLGKGSSRKS